MPIDESEYNLYDSKGNSLDRLKDRNLHSSVRFDKGSAEIIIELNEERRISALGINHLKINASSIKAYGENSQDYLAEFVSKYRISASSDGSNYTEVKRGVILVFGDEVILDFDPRDTKYIKFEALSTVGFESDFPKYMNAKVRIANISLY